MSKEKPLKEILYSKKLKEEYRQLGAIAYWKKYS
jgi:hypothetical protein